MLETPIAEVAPDRNTAGPDAHPCPAPQHESGIEVALLTGGTDKDYAVCLTSSLNALGVAVDFVGSDENDSPELHEKPFVRFLNLRGEQRRSARWLSKAIRVLRYYVRLLIYSVTAQPRIFHILWNNKFQLFDRTWLMLFYKLLGKKVAFTAHNVNAGKRDGNDSFLNRFSLKVQYHLADHVFVHTQRMKRELMDEFAIASAKVTVIPYGLYNNLPNTRLTSAQAKRMLGLAREDKTVLFFGNITPYKGLEYLIGAFAECVKWDPAFRLVIAGAINDCADYWERIQVMMTQRGVRERVVLKTGHVPDHEVEIFFKAADMLVLPYTHIFQSGVLFLGYSFGLPAIATDVGSLKEEIAEGRTGFMCRPRDGSDLGRVLRSYFESDLYKTLDQRRPDIKAYAEEEHSWGRVGMMTKAVYADLRRKVK